METICNPSMATIRLQITCLKHYDNIRRNLVQAHTRSDWLKMFMYFGNGTSPLYFVNFSSRSTYSHKLLHNHF